MIALDTNILVALHREDSDHHRAALQAYHSQGQHTTFAFLWPCLHEFYAIVTHPRIFRKPTPPRIALAAIASWINHPDSRILAETHGYFDLLTRLITTGSIAGPQIHDARIAALCLHHGVRELWTADRDFSRFPQLRTRNPLISSH
ncbi:MAG: PIN domain-containing protein [Methylacidiphilales bacterium]|nr:PIN domain-containing protein [Candidatus Methylacidiphilales bacterium]